MAAVIDRVQDGVGRVSPRLLAVWVALLTLGEADDVYTTHAALSRGGVEGNEMAQGLINMGGTQLMALVDFLVVLAIAILAFLVLRLREQDPSNNASRIIVELIWRGIQLAVFVRIFQAAGNLFILWQLTS
jgi:hypothetical protein